jgi:VCBS repeat-containing protein
VLIGTNGDDQLNGGRGDDRLDGGRGNDSLDGGAGDDRLDGGSGKDNFIFEMDAIGGNDRILDFMAGQHGDVIDLSGLLEGASYTNVAAYLQAELIDDDTIITVDVNGDGSGFDDLTIILEGFETDSIEKLIRDGNLQLPVATSFWSAGDGDSQMHGAADFDMLVVDLANNSDQVLVTPMADGRISIVVGAETLIVDGFEELAFTGTDGDDHITINGDFSGTDLAPNTIFLAGLDGNDFIDTSLITSLHRTVIQGGSGDDILGGGAGNDILHGESGNDYINGRDGDDVLVGGLGDDSLIGGAGNDRADYSYLEGYSERIFTSLVSGSTTETTSNGIFTDALIGIENVIGAAGDDVIIGNGEDNRIDGGAGDDIIFAGAGNDALIGGAGNDFLNGGSGRDTLDYSTAGGSTARVLVDLSLNIAYELNSVGVIAGTDTLVSIENAIGSSGHDEFFGTNQQNILSGLAGDDIFHASASSDTIIGGGGFDVLRINGSYNDYQIAGDDSAATVAGIDGLDSLQGIEKIEFSTGGVSEFYLDGTVNSALPPQLTGFSTDIAENAPGQIIGQVTATDPNNDAVSFTIADGPNSSLFAVDSLTGELSTSGPLDFELQASYVVAVTGTDPSGLSDTTTVVVNALDVEEAPVAQAANIVALGVDAGAVPLRIAAPFDPEGNALSILVREIPDNGSILLLDGSTVALGDELTVEQLTQLQFLPGGSNPSDAGGFTYQVFDDVSGLRTDSRVELSVAESNSGNAGFNLMGADGDDVLYGSRFSDDMTGGDGADTFVIAAGDGGDNVIADFSTAQGDRIDFSALYATLDLNNLTQHFQAGYDGANTTLTLDADADGSADGSVDSSITFKNVDLTTGTHDPNVDAFSKGEVAERLDGGFSPIVTAGLIKFTDADIFDTHQVTAVTAAADALGVVRAQVETDSTFTGEAGAIVWTYQMTPFIAEYLAAGETKVDRFTVLLADSSGAKVKTNVAIEITGTNDQPIVTGGDVSADITEAFFAFGIFDDNSSDDLSNIFSSLNQDRAITSIPLQLQTILSDNGSIEFHDVDRADTHFVSNIEASAGALGELKAEVSTDTTGTGGYNGLVDWTYTVAGVDVEYLALGESITENFIVTLDDNRGGSVQSSIDVTINGRNDIPFLRSGDLDGAIQRTALMNEGDIISESGFVYFSDADLSDTHTVSVSRASADQWGSLSAKIVHESGGAGNQGVITWQYDVDATQFDKLALGRVKTDQFEITIDDGHGGVSSKIVEVSIDGGELIHDSNAYSVSFEALNQSLWGDGTSGDDLIKSDFWGIDLNHWQGYYKDITAFELEAAVRLELKTGLESTLQLDDGSLNANISYDINVDSTLDIINDTISFDTSAFLLRGGGFTTDFQGGSYEANFVLESEGRAWAEIDPTGFDSFTLIDPDIFKFNIDVHEPSLSSVLGVDEITVDQILTTSQVNPNSNSSVQYQSSATSDNFIEFERDVDELVFGPVSPFGIHVNAGIVDLEASLVDVTLYAGANLTQDFALSLDGLGGVIHFTDATGFEKTDVEFIFGEEIVITDASELYGDDFGRINYEIELDPNAHFFNDTDVGLDVGAIIDFLKLDLGYDFGFGLDDDITLGPAGTLHKKFDVAEWDLLDRDFELNFINQTLSGLNTGEAAANLSPDARDSFFAIDESQNPQSVGTVQASDPERSALTYAIVAGNDDGLFAINATTGEVSTTGAVNYLDGEQYHLNFRVTDDQGNSDRSTLTVFVRDVNFAPESQNDSGTTNANESVIIDVSANDFDPDMDDDESTLTYEFLGQFGDGQVINNHDGTFTFDPDGDFDHLQAGESVQIPFAYQATDSHGLAGNTANVVVTINGVVPPNTAPVPSYSGTPSVAEAQTKLLVTTVSSGDNDVGDSWSYAIIAGNVAGLFSIDGAGNISTTGALDFESVNHYDLEVMVTDSGGLSGMVVVPVSVTNVNEGVNATGFTVSIDENSQGSLGTVDASDPDLGSVKFAISGGNDSAAFAIDELTGEITIISDLNHEQDAQHSLTVRVADSVGETTDATVVVNVNDVNEQPVLSYPQTTFDVEENQTAVDIVAPSLFEDVDSGDFLTFDIAAGNDSGLFIIDANTGMLSTTGPLDFEDTPQFRLELRVTDSGGLSSSANVTINVGDIIEKETTLEAFDSRYYYHTSEHSIATGMSVSNPNDGTDLFPNVRVDGTFAGVSYAALAAINGIASFSDPAEPTYNFAIEPTFELADSIGSFTFTAELGAASASAQVDVRSYTSGDNNLFGADGNDVLLGSAGRNVLNGGAGDDILFGYGGSDVFSAGDGEDLIVGADGVDYVTGGAGDDHSYGGMESDFFYFNTGEDIGNDQVDGGTGESTLRHERDSAIFDSQNSSTYFNIVKSGDEIMVQDANELPVDWSTQRTQTLTNIENITIEGDTTTVGQDFHITLSGDFSIPIGYSPSVISILSSGASAAGLYVDASATTGNGRIFSGGGAGNDVILGGAARDDFFVTEGGNDEFHGGDGDDLITLYPVSTLGHSLIAHGDSGIDSITINSGDGTYDDIQSITSTGDNLITADLDGNVSSFYDFETLKLRSSFNFLSTNTHTVVFEGDFSNALSTTETIRVDNRGGILHFDASGVTSQTSFTVYATANDDILLGGAGNDVLNGDAGDDHIEGGLGADNLTGGDGHDRFVFTANAFGQTVSDASKKDRITDYTEGEVIELAEVFDYIANDLAGSVTSIENIVAPGASDGALQVNYSDTSGAHSVVLATLLGYTGEILFIDNQPSNLIATDSQYIYSTSNHSILDGNGLAIVSPLDGTSLIDPTVLVTGGANNYQVTSSSNGSGTFLSPTAPSYGFSANADFEDSDNSASFTYSADDGGLLVTGQVTIQARSDAALDVSGGDGNDVLIGGSAGAVLRGLGGNDLLIGNGTDRNVLYGGAGDDTVFGSDGSDRIYGEQGNDYLNGLLGSDTFYHDLNALAGEDVFVGDEGSDFLNLLAGNDANQSIFISPNATGNGVDVTESGLVQSFIDGEYINIRGDGSGDGAEGFATVLAGDFSGNLERVIFSGGRYGNSIDLSAVTNSDFSAVYNNSAGNDIYIGSDALDYASIRQAGTSSVSLAGGNDRLTVDQTGNGIGATTADGGAGFDTLQFASSYQQHDLISINGNGAQLMVSFTGVDSTFTGFEILSFGTLGGVAAEAENGATVIFSGDLSNALDSGTIVADSSYGSAGAMIADASAVTSIQSFNFAGSEFDDQLTGGIGNDDLNGGAGNDTITGGIGNDLLTGGEGDDLFVFVNNDFGQDRIDDFEDGLDLLDLSFTNYELNDLIIYQQDADTLVDVGDGNQIQLTGVDSSLITSDDFLI